MPIYKMQRKKDGLQKYRVRINYTDKDGKSHQMDRVAYGMENAKKLEMQLTHENKETNNRMTLQQLYEEYINVKTHEIRETSIQKIKERLSQYVLPRLGDLYIDKINAQTIQSWKSHIENYISLKTHEKLLLSTKKKIYSDFKTLLNYAVKMEYLIKNPSSVVGNFKDPYETRQEMDFYTQAEFMKFITEAKKHAMETELNTNSIYEWNFYIFFNIAFFTGLRKGEIHALKWSDIDGNILHVRRSINQKLKGEDRETPPKNKSSVRDLQLPVPLLNVLEEHYKRYSDIKGFTEDWRICGGEKCLRDTTVQKKNELYSKAANIKTIRIHDFRHSHASLLANNGINIQEIARRLGHTNIEITWNIYSHLYPREEERAVEILNKIV